MILTDFYFVFYLKAMGFCWSIGWSIGWLVRWSIRCLLIYLFVCLLSSLTFVASFILLSFTFFFIHIYNSMTLNLELVFAEYIFSSALLASSSSLSQKSTNIKYAYRLSGVTMVVSCYVNGRFMQLIFDSWFFVTLATV